MSLCLLVGSLPCPDPFWRVRDCTLTQSWERAQGAKILPKDLCLSNRAPNSTGTWHVDHMKDGERPLIL